MLIYKTYKVYLKEINYTYVKKIFIYLCSNQAFCISPSRESATSGQYHFFCLIYILYVAMFWSDRSTPPIVSLYTLITFGREMLTIFLYIFLSVSDHLFTSPVGSRGVENINFVVATVATRF